MPIHAVITAGWVPLYFFLAGYFLLAYFRGASERNHLLFSLLCGSLGLYSLAAAGLYQASTYEEGLVWQRWQLFAPMPVLPLGAHIVCRIVGHAYLRVLATIYAAHVLSAVG